MIYQIIDGKKIIVADVSEPQIQSDWDELDSNLPSYILNKPGFKPFRDVVSGALVGSLGNDYTFTRNFGKNLKDKYFDIQVYANNDDMLYPKVNRSVSGYILNFGPQGNNINGLITVVALGSE